MGDLVPLRPEGPVEVILYEAGRSRLDGVVITYDCLKNWILPKIKENDRVDDAWLEGKKLIVRFKAAEGA